MSVLNQINQQLASYNAHLIAVSKTKTNEAIMALYDVGQRHFGENRVQELIEKESTLPKDILWHHIGHLQKNKVKYIAPFVHLIHAVDSWDLLKKINHEAAKNNRIVSVLLQIKIAEEESKFGMTNEELLLLLVELKTQSLNHIKICGLMGMASFTQDHHQVTKEFTTLKNTFNELKVGYFKDNPHFKEISMGMSGDYQLALECGSTMVRIGSLLFGNRQ